MIRTSTGLRELQSLKRRAIYDNVEITWHDAMVWAHRNGVKLGERDEDQDLALVNARRDEFGLPRFMIIMQRGAPARVPLPHLGGTEGKWKATPRKRTTADELGIAAE